MLRSWFFKAQTFAANYFGQTESAAVVVPVVRDADRGGGGGFVDVPRYRRRERGVAIDPLPTVHARMSAAGGGDHLVAMATVKHIDNDDEVAIMLLLAA